MDENKNEAQVAEEQASVLENSEEAETTSVEETDETTVEGNESEETTDAIDYEAELEKARKLAEKGFSKADKERAKRVEAQKNALTREEVEKLVEEKTAAIRKSLFQSQAENLALSLSKTTAEKDLILHYYHNSIVPTGNLEEDMENAYALANRKRIAGQMSELKRAALSKKTINGASDSGQPVEVKKPVKFSQEIIEAAAFAGQTPEEFVKHKLNK